eukprot:TRINITY_DN22271_c0_g1_i1.p1 TRINITY_DN22271_c0_g1~~TRINITY_DN22271_c0_g1_i1.p1  ORF type:complete len:821 (-),score=101.28 TRINITY_DN22271_c0_g1_i1:470-2932(-)
MPTLRARALVSAFSIAHLWGDTAIAADTCAVGESEAHAKSCLADDVQGEEAEMLRHSLLQKGRLQQRHMESEASNATSEMWMEREKLPLVRESQRAKANQGWGSCQQVGCGAAYDPSRPCQCNSACMQFHSCCDDFLQKCPQHAAGHDSGLRTTATPCRDKESCLQKVDAFLERQTRNANDLLQTYGDNSFSQGGGFCGTDCYLNPKCPGMEALHKCRFDTYDNALAAIYYTKRGRFKDAKRLLDALIKLLYPGKEVRFNGKKVSYGARDGLPSGRWLTLLAASYTSVKAKAGDYWGAPVMDAAVDVGNNAWAALAFAHYSADANEPCYAVVAHDILAAIKAAERPCNDFLQGFTARLEPFPKFYRSTEHNIDMYAVARMLGDTESQRRAGSFVHGMYAYSSSKWEKEVYATGTDMRSRCDTGMTYNYIPVDGQTWNLLADADDVPERKRASIKQTLKPSSKGGFMETNKDIIGNRNNVGRDTQLVGMRFSTRGNGAQWENSASGLMSLIHYKSKYGEMLDGQNITKDIEEIRNALKALLETYGSVLASVLGGNAKAWQKHPGLAAAHVDYPGGSDTGFEWTYLRYPHVAATAWTGMALLMQADGKQWVNKNANPYAPPARPVPDKRTAAAAAGQCLSGNGASPGPAPVSPGPAPWSPAPRPMQGNCASFGCGGGYQKQHACQCTTACKQFGNCCSDYDSKCGGQSPAPAPWPRPSPPAPSGAPPSSGWSPPGPAPASGNRSCKQFGCYGYKPNNPCQCTGSCKKYGNCCSDYDASCGHRPPAPAPSGNGNAACSSHPACHGLHGDCCPAPGGVFLGCCR